MGPTGRTVHHLRKLGFRADKVEQTIPNCFIKRDLFGIGDVLAMKAGESLLLDPSDRDGEVECAHEKKIRRRSRNG